MVWAMFFDDTHTREKFSAHMVQQNRHKLHWRKAGRKIVKTTRACGENHDPPAMPTATRARFFPGKIAAA